MHEIQQQMNQCVKLVTKKLNNY